MLWKAEFSLFFYLYINMDKTVEHDMALDNFVRSGVYICAGDHFLIIQILEL